ncbi:glycoside hydrolase family 3 C-terminal domain-containing protein [Herbiconiux sp. CPCC 205716]|uniref:Glycoside hydrolase family 3 C-terminal domain-containing protein n=1 Tax=Herbiconiux gentiana TaxID=2970912 RepID=A0ABT2GE27_9MICO|nr:glycoside hydrolase family 3 N-terminal domain-containing protein [Herbiconiux gentiana]MCS5713134.1 glycoside hydrolase family 3 C-terminal domain-containing protein [Herbiconiux gentiana]
MTLQEKLQQLGSTWPDAANASGDVAPMQETQLQAEPFDTAIESGIGQLTRPFGTAPVEPAEGMRRLAALQRQVVSANRFGIPAVAHEECLTGFTAWKATVYPTSIAWAATFNPTLVREMAAAIGRDLASVGIHQGLSPVLDVVRDYRWGRVEETLGEDPYLVGELAAAYVQGLQSQGVVATLKHFAGYSASRGARNHAPVSIGPRELADVTLVPFEKAVVKAGARSVMNSYTELDGVPSAVDRDLLTTLLRETWGFTGTVVSDYWSIPFVATMHRTASGNVDAGEQTLRAGIDVELPHTLGYTAELIDAVADSGELIDRAVHRVLAQKAELGLLDEGWLPSDPEGPIDLDSPGNRHIARQMAEQSLVLLSNTRSGLPLRHAPTRIAVVGPGADDPGCFFGCYSFPNHVMPNHPDLGIGVVAPTILDAVRSEFPGSQVRHAGGVGITGGSAEGISEAVSLAEWAEFTVLVVGDRSGMFGHGTSGEGCDALDLTLPGLQQEFAQSVLAAAGERTALIVLSGRPYAIGGHSANAMAAVQAFFPGEEAGGAIAGVLSGRVNPSGRLPVQIPGAASSQPGTYLAPPLALRSEGVSNLDPTPAFAFGHGLGYSEFRTAVESTSSVLPSVDGSLDVTVRVTNAGDRDGATVVQLYLSDPVATVTRPVRQLIGFARVELAARESANAVFTVHADLTSFTGRDLRRRIEPGAIVLTVADNALEPGIELDVEVVGPVRHVDHNRVMTAPVVITKSSL